MYFSNCINQWLSVHMPKINLSIYWWWYGDSEIIMFSVDFTPTNNFFFCRAFVKQNHLKINHEIFRSKIINPKCLSDYIILIVYVNLFPLSDTQTWIQFPCVVIYISHLKQNAKKRKQTCRHKAQIKCYDGECN